MTNEASTVSLAELAEIEPLRSVEAVTIVREIINRILDGSIAGVPSPQVIRLSDAGRITVEGPIAADARTVAHAAHLLSTLLPGFDVRTKDRVPGALRLVVARALGTLDLPDYSTLDAFAADLGRFAAADAQGSIRGLVTARRLAATDSTVETLDVALNSGERLTISDIRRARRATGLTLGDISGRTGIPAPLLCELEWGYLHHWPAPAMSRRLILRYARTAGLDEQLVLDIAWPLLEALIRERDDGPKDLAVIDAVPLEGAEIEAVGPIPNVVSLVARHHSNRTRWSRRRSLLVAALAIPALLVIGIAPPAREYVSLRH